MNQFANVLSQIAEESIKELFKKRIADTIGMNPDNWNWGDFGEIDGMLQEIEHGMCCGML